jgi:hypothetical protein
LFGEGRQSACAESEARGLEKRAAGEHGFFGARECVNSG